MANIRTPQEIIENRLNFKKEIIDSIVNRLDYDLEKFFNEGSFTIHNRNYLEYPKIFTEVLEEFEKHGWNFEIKQIPELNGYFGRELHFTPNGKEES